MMFRDRPTLERVLWQDIREQVLKVNTHLCELIDAIGPDDKYPFYLARYPYGAKIVERGILQLPIRHDKLLPASNCKVPRSIRDELLLPTGGAQIPPGVMLRNSIEVGLSPRAIVFPAFFYTEGEIFGLWGALDDNIPFYHPYGIFDVSSGARCVAMLPRIGQSKGYCDIVRRLGFSLNPPKKMQKHHRLFVDLVNQPYLRNDWCSELLFFTKPWLEMIRGKDKAWVYLREFLLNAAWRSTAYFRNQYLYDSAFSWAQANRNLRPDPYLADTARYLVGVACGFISGFVPAVDDRALPVSLIQRVFVEAYGLRKYVPTIMHPGYFNPLKKDQMPVYYSLRFPTAAEFSPRARKDLVALQDLCELKHITQRFLEEIAQDKVCMHDTVLEFVANNVNFNYFHHRQDRYQEVRLSQEMPRGDNRLSQSLVDCKNDGFPADSPFLQGCVRVSSKNMDDDEGNTSHSSIRFAGDFKKLDEYIDKV